MLGMNEIIDQLAKSNGLHWYGHVMRGKYGHVLGSSLVFEGDGQRSK